MRPSYNLRSTESRFDEKSTDKKLNIAIGFVLVYALLVGIWFFVG